MTRQILIRPEAEADLTEAFDWYEDRVAGLGAEYLVAVDAAFRAIIRNPEQFPVIYRTVRRALLRRFPYMVLFQEEELQTVVIAVFHARRDPKRWQERTDSPAGQE